MHYYYLDANNTVQGPHTVAELLCMLSEDQITLSTLIAEEGGDEWREIRTKLSSLSTTARPPSILQPAHLPIEDQKNNTEYLYSEHKDMVIISVFLSSLIGGSLLCFGVRKNSPKLANLAGMIGILSMLVWFVVIYSTILVGGRLDAFLIIIITLGIILSCIAYEAINKRKECPKWWRFGRYGAVCFSFSVIAVSWLFFPVTKKERRANIDEIHHSITTGVKNLYSTNRVIKSNKKRSHKTSTSSSSKSNEYYIKVSNKKVLELANITAKALNSLATFVRAAQALNSSPVSNSGDYLVDMQSSLDDLGKVFDLLKIANKDLSALRFHIQYSVKISPQLKRDLTPYNIEFISYDATKPEPSINNAHSVYKHLKSALDSIQELGDDSIITSPSKP